MAKLGTFSEYSCVAESQVIKVEPDLPLDVVCLVSCGVATGWGSATNRGDIRPGDTVVVVGCGGIGMNAVQGAKMAGAKHVVAVDPVEFPLYFAAKLRPFQILRDDSKRQAEAIGACGDEQGLRRPIVA